jgi:hypothetical protein
MSGPADGLIVRTVTISELMDAAGEMWITIATTGDPTIWQQLGMVEAGAESVRLAVRTMWAEDQDEDD